MGAKLRHFKVSKVVKFVTGVAKPAMMPGAVVKPWSGFASGLPDRSGRALVLR
jgi:hypothetical protein